jgi:hypothetical protein
MSHFNKRAVLVEPIPMPTGRVAEICVTKHKFGFAATLHLENGNELPMSFGAQVPSTAAEAMRLAKKFLLKVYTRMI